MLSQLLGASHTGNLIAPFALGHQHPRKIVKIGNEKNTPDKLIT